MNFYNKLDRAWSDSNSLVCVGLDTDLDKIPGHLKALPHPVYEFNKQIIAATADLVCAYKLQIAYYNGQAIEDQLRQTINYLAGDYPHLPIILDAKRNDIGNTAAMYAKEAFDRYDADAVTVNPYLGGDSLQPFLERKDKGTIILCRTSNPGGNDLQNLEMNGCPLYQIVAETAARKWNANANIALVVGATYPHELGKVRSIVGSMPLLVPGVGAQGGDVDTFVKIGLSENGTGMIINSSRGIIYAGEGMDFAGAARNAALELRDAINLCR